MVLHLQTRLRRRGPSSVIPSPIVMTLASMTSPKVPRPLPRPLVLFVGGAHIPSVLRTVVCGIGRGEVSGADRTKVGDRVSSKFRRPYCQYGGSRPGMRVVGFRQNFVKISSTGFRQNFVSTNLDEFSYCPQIPQKSAKSARRFQWNRTH